MRDGISSFKIFTPIEISRIRKGNSINDAGGKPGAYPMKISRKYLAIVKCEARKRESVMSAWARRD